MLHIVVAFSESDLTLLSKNLDSNCILLSEVACQQTIAKHKKPQLNLRNEYELSSKVKEIFDFMELNCKIDSLGGYANNFYECTVAPLLEYIVTLGEIIEDLSKTQKRITIWFPSFYLIKTKFSAYFLAEHETQGQRLYSREAVYLPYLEEVCNRHNVIIKYQSYKLGLLSLFQRKIRVAAVLIWRILVGMRNAVNRSNVNIKNICNSAEIIAITRTTAQTEFLMPFLIKNQIKTALLTSESTIQRGLNGALVKEITSEYNSIVWLDLKFSLKQLFSNYLHALWLMVTKPSVELISNDVKINLDQAMTEVLAMWPDLLTYRDALQKNVLAVGATEKKILISTEQKSPHAHADAWVAAKCGLICIHLMQCDQIARPLPNPISGDYFLADSRSNAAKFAKIWNVNDSRVIYKGSFKAINNLNKCIINEKKRVCFFSAADDVATNKKVLQVLREIAKTDCIEFFIKLHPRDSAINYSEYAEFDFYCEGAMRKYELYESFNFAITYASGVVLDLIFANKPFLLLRFGKWRKDDFHYIDDDYAGNIFEPEKIKKMIVDDGLLQTKFNTYREKFYYANDIIDDPEIIWKEILKIRVSAQHQLN